MAQHDSLRVKPGKTLKLRERSPGDTAPFDSKDAAATALAETLGRLAEQQIKLHAAASHSVLIVLQGMDAAGKDGIIANLASGLNPQGCEVTSFKAPSLEEQQHDFLWRCHARVPRRGRIGIFNRSHYEDVLIQRVHPDFVVASRLPGIDAVKDVSAAFWESRYEQIRNFEASLVANGTVVLKFFLHISRNEQRDRLMKRIAEPSKNWKFDAGDLKERAFWDAYQDAYEAALDQTSTKVAPWYVIPADKKWFARAAIASIVTEALEDLHLKTPELSKEGRSLLESARQELEAEQ